MSRAARELIGDWLTVLGAASLLLSLFLVWSHQFSSGFLAQWGTSAALQGVPHDPTAWQVYSVVDVLLAALAVGLLVVALVGARMARVVALVCVGVALAFVVHALRHPPTNGANVFVPSLGRYAANSPRAGAGEVVAVMGLGVAMAGLVLSFTAD